MAVSGTTPMLASRTPMYSEVAASRSIPRVCLGGLVDGGSGCCDVLSGSCWLLAWILRQACSKLAAILRQSCRAQTFRPESFSTASIAQAFGKLRSMSKQVPRKNAPRQAHNVDRFSKAPTRIFS